MKAKLFDVVKLKVSINKKRLAEGDQELLPGSIGTVIEVFDRPSEGYDVEFLDDSGHEIATCNLKPNEFDVIHNN